MKKEITALSLLILLFAGSLLNLYCLDKTIDGVKQEVDSSYDSFLSGDSTAAAEELEKAIMRWEDASTYTYIVVRHSEIDSTSEALFETLGLVKEGEHGEAEGAYRSLFYHLKNLVDMERVTLGSIF